MAWLHLLHKSDNSTDKQTELNFIVFGGGQVATRKIQTLLKSSANIWLFSSKVTDQLQRLANDSKIELLDVELDNNLVSQLNFDELVGKSLLTRNTYVIAATSDSDLNQSIADRSKQQGFAVNIVDDALRSDYIFPAVIHRGPVNVAVSSSGQSPALTRMIKNQLDAFLPQHTEKLAEFIAGERIIIRKKIREIKIRQKLWQKIMASSVSSLVLAGKESEAKIQLDVLVANFLSDANDGGNKQVQMGEVFLVGAGPGDAELLTFKALRLMQQADVVFYDRLVSQQILDMCPINAQMKYVGKAQSDHSVPQNQINQLLADYAKQGKKVLRLKGGDPFIFGRGGEEIELLAENNVPFQVVPGITAANGCSAYAGIPLTHRDYAQSVRFVTGHLRASKAELEGKDMDADKYKYALPWNELVHPNQTLVIYMGLNGIDIICDQLVKHGMSEDTPIALVEKGTTPDQKVYTSTLKDMPELVANTDIGAPTLTIVGSVVSLREKLISV